MSDGTELPEQTGHDLPQSTVYGVFPARDGNLVIAAQVDDSWKRLAQLIGGEELAADTRFHSSAGRNEHREEILQRIREWTMAQSSVAACCEALDAAAVPAGPVRTIDQVLTDPQTLEREMVIEQEHPVLGKIKMTNLPFRFSDCDTSPRSVAPLLGQHNHDIASELGFSDDEIAAMQADGVLYAEEDVARFCEEPGGEV